MSASSKTMTMTMTMTGFFAAQFEMHALQRLSTLEHDHAARAAFADKGDGFDVGVLGQRAACACAHAFDQIQYAGGQSCLMPDLGQQASGEGGEFGRLVNHRAACGERGRDLPSERHEGHVPGCGHADRAD